MSPDAPRPEVDYPHSFHELTSWFGDEDVLLASSDSLALDRNGRC
jgi:hypothetical protein